MSAAAIYLALDGCHATGTSTHADALAEALRRQGFDAAAYHHPRHPEGCGPEARVAWYAGARAQLVGLPPAPVVVMDRGPVSGIVYARSTGLQAPALFAEADARRWAQGLGLRWAWLDADDALLCARIAARGERPELFEAERRRWREASSRDRSAPWARSLAVDTGRPAADVRAELLAWALGALKAGVL